MRLYLFWVIVACVGICLLISFFGTIDMPQIHTVDATKLPLSTPLKPQKDIHPAILKVNEQNRAIRSIQADSLDIKQHQHRLAKLTGTFALEKDMCFRLTIQSQLGNEMDLGSNDTIFWFWSKRYENGSLFFCKHTDVDKARLKRPFNPSRMMRSFGYHDIDMSQATMVPQGKYLAVVKYEKNNMRTVRLVDPERPAIIGCYLYDNSNQVVASTEATKFDPSGKYPVKWLLRWNEEGLSMEMELLNPRFNAPINPALWKLPTMNRMIDMATD